MRSRWRHFRRSAAERSPLALELFDDVERRDDPRSPACEVRHKRLLVQSAIVENNGIRAEQIAEEMQGRHAEVWTFSSA